MHFFRAERWLVLAQLGSWVHLVPECTRKFLYHPTIQPYNHTTIQPYNHPIKDTRFSPVFPPNFVSFFKLLNQQIFAFIQVLTQFFSLPPFIFLSTPKKFQNLNFLIEITQKIRNFNFFEYPQKLQIFAFIQVLTQFFSLPPFIFLSTPKKFQNLNFLIENTQKIRNFNFFEYPQKFSKLDFLIHVHASRVRRSDQPFQYKVKIRFLIRFGGFF